jgi:hypothetical protein
VAARMDPGGGEGWELQASHREQGNNSTAMASRGYVVVQTADLILDNRSLHMK